MTAYAYLRKSSVHDLSREVSHEVQESAVRGLAARYGDEDSMVLLSDWDKSGRLGADKRPGYRALLDAIEDGRCTAVYSYSLSRLARSVAELARLLDYCGSRKIPVRLEADHLDTSTASGVLLANVLGSVAQFEADVASERVLAANAAKRARGERVGTAKCYGEADGEDASVVMAAFAEAGSYSAAAKLLNVRGVQPRNSKRGWWPSSVAVVVNRVGGTRQPARGARAGGSDFLLARLMRCPTCGTMLTASRDREGSRVRYACRMGTAIPHPRISITEHFLLPDVRDEVARLRVPMDVVEAKEETAERSELEARRTRILDMYESGMVDRDERDRRMAAVYGALEGLDARRVVMAVPPVVDWSWPVRKVNAVLRALFVSITLDPVTFRMVSAEWRVPEWRA